MVVSDRSSPYDNVAKTGVTRGFSQASEVSSVARKSADHYLQSGSDSRRIGRSKRDALQ